MKADTHALWTYGAKQLHKLSPCLADIESLLAYFATASTAYARQKAQDILTSLRCFTG
jgi:hypothetical protein